MIGRVLLAALLAGIAAGLIMAAIQHLRLTPMIVAAERFETAGHDHAATGEAAAAESHDHGEGWAPAMAGSGRSPPPSPPCCRVRPSPFCWPPCRWCRASPSRGATGSSGPLRLPCREPRTCRRAGARTSRHAGRRPRRPPDLVAGHHRRDRPWPLPDRRAREFLDPAAAVVLIVLPHLIGAPAPVSHESAVPPGLAAAFAANALAANAIFWC